MQSVNPLVNRAPVIFVLVIFMLLAACGTIQVGNDFELNRFESRVQRGVTTKAQVKAWLGNPGSTGVVVESSGQRLQKWTYYYGSGDVAGRKRAKLKYLEVQFDRDDRVIAYNWSN
jgi:hypothetical protein